MNFNAGATAELKKLIIPIMSHLPVMMIVAYRTRPRMCCDQASGRGRAAVSTSQSAARRLLFCFVFFGCKTTRRSPDIKRNGSAPD